MTDRMTQFVHEIAEHLDVSPDDVEIVVRCKPPEHVRHCKVCASALGNDAQAQALGCCSGTCARAAALLEVLHR